MSNESRALTFDGNVDIESAIPLEQLKPGDTVLGIVNPNDSGEPRTMHVVVATLGMHHVPAEDPTILERFLTRAALGRLVAGERAEGILVESAHGPSLFALETTPVLDRVIC